jgi:DNA-directed RNA polymerase sigma subunit (sigma70/sigma32)
MRERLYNDRKQYHAVRREMKKEYISEDCDKINHNIAVFWLEKSENKKFVEEIISKAYEISHNSDEEKTRYNRFSAKSLYVLICRFWLDMSLCEIGKKMRWTRERVRQIEGHALMNLRRMMKKHEQ